jgi:DNA-binding NarL/FixJ family response regulator
MDLPGWRRIRAQKCSIDVLLLDITLPGASSREVFSEARRLRPDMRVIITSAYGKDLAAASLEHKFEHYSKAISA